MRIKVLKEPVTPADEDFQKLSAAQIRWLFAKGAAKDKNGKVVVDFDKAHKKGFEDREVEENS